MAASLATWLLRALEALAERHVDFTGPAALGLPSEVGDEMRPEQGAPPPLGGPRAADGLAPLHEARSRTPQPPGSQHHDDEDGDDPSRARREPPAERDRAPPKSSQQAGPSSR